jgi:arginyl-tRNA synthetase
MLMEKAVEYLVPHVPISKTEILDVLEYPPNADLGDIAFPCFTLAKLMKKSPNQIAQDLAQAIQTPELVTEAAGPYLNLKFNRASMAQEFMAYFRSSAFQKINLGNGKRVIIDMSSPNIAKPFGIGHLRSTMIGNALYLILREVGYETVNVNHLGDWGTQFGKQIAAYLRWGDPEKIKADPIKSYLELYVKFHKEAEEHPELEDEARMWFQKLEAGDEQAVELWKKSIDESLQEFKKLYHRLGVEFDYYLGESFYNDKMDPVVKLLEDKGLLEESEGAMVVRLDEQELPPCIIVKSDGTSIYATRDLATAMYRHDVMKGDRLIYVVGAEQSLHFRQVFSVLAKMGFDWYQECKHIPFGLMKIEGQKMSTRRGKVVFLEDVLNEAVERALQKIEEKNPTLADKEEVAEAIGIGAVVFGDLKNTRTLEVDFTLEEVLNFDGETGPYLQYTFARTQSILTKSKDIGGISADYQYIADPHSWRLMKTLSLYPEVLAKAAERLEPSVLARYLIDLAQDFNRFYHNVRVLTDTDTEQFTKMELVRAVSQCLQKGLTLLGLKPPREI